MFSILIQRPEVSGSAGRGRRFGGTGARSAAGAAARATLARRAARRGR